MADSVVHIGENSPEQVSYKLMRDIMVAEGKDWSSVDRPYLLSLYVQCLNAVKLGRDR